MAQAIEPADDAIFARCARRLLPFIMLLYVVNYVDRVNVGFAALTMNNDLNLSPSEYGFGGSIWSIGYLLFQIPASLILVKLGARRWVFLMLGVWGVVSACNALITGPYSYYGVRFALGVAEAGFFPGMLLYMAFWFPDSWRGRFVGIFMAAIPLANIIGGPLSTSILSMNGIAGLHGWQWMFILEGIPVTLLAFASLKLLPDRPANATWLTPDEKTRVRRVLATDSHAEKKDFWPGLFDVRVIALGLVLLGNQCALYGVQLWLPQIVHGMGFSNFATGFVVALCFIVGMVAMILWARHSDAHNERIWHVIIPLGLATLGLILAAAAQSPLLMLVALTLSMAGTLAYNGPFFSLPATFLAGTAAAGGIGFINTIGSLGRFIGPWMVGVLKQESGGYSSALAVLATLMLGATLLVFVMGRLMAVRKLRYS
ncbi:MAG TPA: MFS transporter [Micropepsaceae bacterium]|nr:MFS transporter [Micropepsaceae bacterium]